MKFDLHVHSNFSDGDYSIEDLVDLYRDTNLDGFALTDHDNIDGLLYLKKLDLDYKILNGVEFSCSYEGEEVHILGIDISVEDKELLELTEDLKLDRVNRAKEMVRRLEADGYILDQNRIFKNNSVGRPHIAKALCDKAYASSLSEAFEKFLLEDSKYYVERKYLSIDRAIEVIMSAGGISILAHPGRLKNVDLVLDYVKHLPLDGLEVYHPSNSKEMTEKLLRLAKERSYFISGGSDFHRNKDDVGKYYGHIIY